MYFIGERTVFIKYPYCTSKELWGVYVEQGNL
jgi:hypothetical protein